MHDADRLKMNVFDSYQVDCFDDLDSAAYDEAFEVVKKAANCTNENGYLCASDPYVTRRDTEPCAGCMDSAHAYWHNLKSLILPNCERFENDAYKAYPMPDDFCTASLWEAFPVSIRDLMPTVMRDGMVTTAVTARHLYQGFAGMHPVSMHQDPDRAVVFH
jgi:hypothetical protein